MLYPDKFERLSGGQVLRGVSHMCLTCEHHDHSGWVILFTLFPDAGDIVWPWRTRD